ncbi:AMP-binding protein [Variovorax sp. H27-G14]|uniref:AMP-binding protein n=1 Tax=Variovorax sp. H27-G14 TaxID=3111914 RepID=UPI0038FC65D4
MSATTTIGTAATATTTTTNTATTTATATTGWNMADILDGVARRVPADRPAIVHGTHVVTWGELDARSNRVARALLTLGHGRGERVAILSRNHPGYIEGFVACLKARLVPLNLNYRYTVDEVAGVLDDAGATALLYQQEFAPLVAALAARGSALRTRMCLDGEGLGEATASFQALAAQGDGSALDIVRSESDPLLLYTGGTTGKPKGVIWPGNRYRECHLESPLAKHRPANLQEHLDTVAANDTPGRVLPACPLMHGAGISSTLSELLSGGTALLLAQRSFDPHELWQLAQHERATRILIVGDVFARPMLQALDEQPGRYDLSALRVISSAGLMWSEEVKAGLLRHLPKVVLADIYGASEAAGLGYSITTTERATPTGRFEPGPRTVMVGDDGRIVPAGQVGEGWLARGEPLPEGYFGDPVKTAEVFRTIDGERYSVPGDRVQRHADGSMQLLGRGSLVINSGGEKIYVEEVEEALKRVPGVQDVLVVGVPDVRWGSAIVALLRTGPGGLPDTQAMRAHLAPHLAGYKMPRHYLAVDQLPRADSGKGDYRAARALADSLLRTP